MTSKKPDKRTMSKIYPDNVNRLRKVAETVQSRTNVKASFDATVNAAITFGLPELEKQTGVK